MRRRECQERFPRHRGLTIPTCFTHLPLCMSVFLITGFLWIWWRGKCFRHSRGLRNQQFYVSGKKPLVRTPHLSTVWHKCNYRLPIEYLVTDSIHIRDMCLVGHCMYWDEYHIDLHYPEEYQCRNIPRRQMQSCLYDKLNVEIYCEIWYDISNVVILPLIDIDLPCHIAHKTQWKTSVTLKPALHLRMT